MALIWIEGFDQYGTLAQMVQQTGYLDSSVNSSIVTDTTRTGRAAFRFISSASTAFTRFTGLAGTGNRRVLGFAVNHAGTNSLLRVEQWATAQGVAALAMQFSGNVPSLVVGANAPLWSSVEADPSGIWIYYELRVDLANTAAGAFELRRNGVPIASGTNVITRLNAADVVSGINIRGISAGAVSATLFDDLYLCDGAGTINNDFLGTRRVQTLVPDGPAVAGWTPNTGTNWQAVDEMGPDDDTTFVAASSAGPVDRHTLQDLPPAVTSVSGVRLIYRARKVDSGTAQMRGVLASPAGVINAAVQAPDLTYQYFSSTHERDAANNVWTPAEVNALTAGVERTA